MTPITTVMPLTPLSEAPKHLAETRAILNPTWTLYLATVELYEIDSEKPGEGVDKAFEWDEISYCRVLINMLSLNIS